MRSFISEDEEVRFSEISITPPEASPGSTWWTRRFRGGADQVPEVRRWLKDLLPDCAVRADVLLLATELCANAIAHSRSGEAGGQFSVDVDWAPALARVVIGDQGSAQAPAIARRASELTPVGESGRGLLLVDDVADDWGTTSCPNRRWVWADVQWQARGGRLLAAPGGLDAAIASNAMIRKAFPGTSLWWGHLTQSWWAAVPGSTNVHGLLRAPTPDSLIRAVVRAYPRAVGQGRRHRPPHDLLPAGTGRRRGSPAARPCLQQPCLPAMSSRLAGRGAAVHALSREACAGTAAGTSSRKPPD